jgi:hypothetical protein
MSPCRFADDREQCCEVIASISAHCGTSSGAGERAAVVSQRADFPRWSIRFSQLLDRGGGDLLRWVRVAPDIPLRAKTERPLQFIRIRPDALANWKAKVCGVMRVHPVFTVSPCAIPPSDPGPVFDTGTYAPTESSPCRSTRMKRLYRALIPSSDYSSTGTSFVLPHRCCPRVRYTPL